MANSKQTFTASLQLLVALCALELSAGCKMSQPASASFASVVISGKTPDEIRNATTATFVEAGYRVSHSSGDLVFEKEGSKMNQLARGDWISEKPVRERVRAQIVPTGGGTWRLQCNAYMVRSPGDGFFEDEVKLADFRSTPYQKLLDNVAARMR